MKNLFNFKRKIKFISLFAGGGGSSLGYHYAKFQELFAFEWDKFAAKIFSLNFPKVNICQDDILQLSGEDILEMIKMKPGELDHLDASPPCQDFSRAKGKKRKPEGKRNELYLKTLTLIDVIQPKTFLIENVKGMLDKTMLDVWSKIIFLMNKMNYQIQFKVVNATDFGVPQARERLIMVGVRNDIAEFIDVRSFFPLHNSKREDMYVSKFLPHLIGVSPGQFKDEVKLACFKPSPTITKTPSLWVYENDGLRRKPTIEELKILSGFPESFILCGEYNAQFGIIGNAVPPPITYALGKHIKENILEVYYSKIQNDLDIQSAA